MFNPLPGLNLRTLILFEDIYYERPNEISFGHELHLYHVYQTLNVVLMDHLH